MGNNIACVFLNFANENITYKATAELLCISEQHIGNSFLNESGEPMIQWPVNKHLRHSWINQEFEGIEWMNVSMT